MLRRQLEKASASRSGRPGTAWSRGRAALSILDLVRVTEETDARGALDNARDLARRAEGWGCRRVKPKAARDRRRQAASRRARQLELPVQ
jgi:hypothetical protein